MSEGAIQARASRILDALAQLEISGNRRFIAIAGPPTSGKSTLAGIVCDTLVTQQVACGLVAMDGFHLSNEILDDRGLRKMKGAPETFDLDGFKALLHRLNRNEDVYVPRFDRDLDASIGSAIHIPRETDVILAEGNYLLLDEPGWRELVDFWDLVFFLDTEIDDVERRSIKRWLSHGDDQDVAKLKARENDVPNARRVIENRIKGGKVVVL